ncbi:MAG: pentapeptide repeat-containing protein [Thermoanaerobaculia bacterium]
MSELSDATGSLFHGCNLEATLIQGAMLNGATFYQCNLRTAEASFAKLAAASFVECDLSRSQFMSANLDRATFTNCNQEAQSLQGCIGESLVIQNATALDGLTLDGARVPFLKLHHVIGRSIQASAVAAPNADIAHAGLLDATFSGSNFTDSRWLHCNLDSGNYERATLAGATFVDCSMRGANLSDVAGQDLRILRCVLIDACLQRISARGGAFRNSALTRVNARGAYLYGAFISGEPPSATSLRGADLSDAILVQAYITADLTDAVLTNAKCSYSRLNQSLFVNSDFRGATLAGASLVKSNFTGSKFSNIAMPFFTDRCVGLIDAIDAIPDVEVAARLREFVAESQKLYETSRVL